MQMFRTESFFPNHYLSRLIQLQPISVTTFCVGHKGQASHNKKLTQTAQRYFDPAHMQHITGSATIFGIAFDCPRSPCAATA